MSGADLKSKTCAELVYDLQVLTGIVADMNSTDAKTNNRDFMTARPNMVKVVDAYSAELASRFTQQA